MPFGNTENKIHVESYDDSPYPDLRRKDELMKRDTADDIRLTINNAKFTSETKDFFEDALSLSTGHELIMSNFFGNIQAWNRRDFRVNMIWEAQKRPRSERERPVFTHVYHKILELYDYNLTKAVQDTKGRNTFHHQYVNTNEANQHQVLRQEPLLPDEMPQEKKKMGFHIF